MALDYSTLSDQELEAIANDDYSKLSDATLQSLAGGPDANAVPEPGGAAPQFYPTGTGVGMPNVGGAIQTAGKIVKPAASAVGSTLGTYLTNPVAALTDLTMSHFGMPPPVASTKITPGVQESYQQIKDYLTKQGQFKPTTLTGGANPAFDTAMNTPHPSTVPGTTPAAPVAGGPAAQEGKNFITSIAQKFAPMARAVGPVLNTVGRVAGPAGLAYNAYEGAKFAQDAQLGQRLAQGQGQSAEQAFRAMNIQYGAPITREQAATVLQSNNPRDIQAFGGIDRLRAIAGL